MCKVEWSDADKPAERKSLSLQNNVTIDHYLIRVDKTLKATN